jgi:hypothetical protein
MFTAIGKPSDQEKSDMTFYLQFLRQTIRINATFDDLEILNAFYLFLYKGYLLLRINKPALNVK